MSESEFVLELSKLGISLNEHQLDLFRKYADFLMDYNSHTNLTAIKTKEEIYLKHFYDSLLLLKYYDISNKKVLDIGTGAGFPGVPLKIVNDSIDLTLLDSNGKKTEFLEKLKSELNIDFVVINERAEKYILERREYFDVVVSRAVTQMPILAELTIPFVKVGGKMISYKGNIDDSLEEGVYAIQALGGKVDDIIADSLPDNLGKRTFVLVSKICQTDVIYPRVFDKIVKKPLQKK